MATYTFKPIPVWGTSGSLVRVGTSQSKTFPVTTLAGAAATVVQSGVTKVGYVESDSTGMIPQFTTTDIPSVLLDLSFGVLAIHSLEAITAGAASAAAAASSATAAASSATIAGSSATAAAGSATSAASSASSASSAASAQVATLLSGGLVKPELMPGGTSLGDTGRRYRKVLGTLRNTGSGWAFISDAGHRPNGVDATTPVTVTSTGIVVTYGFTGTKVASVAVVPDETFAGLGLRVGTSVGLNDVTIQMFRDDPYTIADYVFYDGSAWVSFGGKFTPTYNSGTGVLTLTHEDMGTTGHQAVLASPRGTAAALSGGFTATTSQVVFNTGAWGSLTPTGAANTAQHKVYAVRHGYRTAVPPVDPATVVSATGNLWVIGEMEVAP